ncbi:ERG9 Phytoene squalene synthetase [Pyrenophora tritici-repentis]|uniref:Squalene synthase n=2 Tax=Pyrenophora tritici-repentis TaxID=45151 RepID=A0A2W1E8I6_9PLEO|nr:squalene synthetase [Pyrenophora tritici-repentis Pt-1C-BFP]KAA8615053.1 Squalene synthetase [Pyrenophora tritici-repentis]EDU50381.1 squalene synthetase [Pyrenophora tritici-repentis Pt-1C-BFP]KAF7444876.1 Squalene synthetase [Pyrenophora tritici-repentis]KAF7564456.1 ERG9, Phytoene-squalene synthetase [Pyrenophora tritici-repentis]KAG9379117.1 Squalene synthetase [Pyrenophora tritici-repentis]
MPSPMSILYYAVHPSELRSIIQWKVWHNPVHERNEAKESESLKRCFHFLNKTSRSFAAVILELHPDLLVPVTLFYLVLRGLDTVEDDMTIPLAKKEPILRNFQDLLEQDGWNFTENGPNEKDRQLLVEFNVVIEEFKKIKPAYQEIIKDITKRMGNGMADYANNAEFNAGVDTIKDYELYCHYVAGLVGEGCTRLFVEAGLANAALLKKPELMESMGQFLQQVNITRDIKEDLDDGRRFWPREIWSKHVDKFEDLFKEENKQKALNCSSEMILTALTRADDCLYYLAGLREQSVFNFCAIPQTMAIATLETCFQNYALFQKNVKITKGEACQLMVESTQNLQLVCEVFRRYARKIAKKNNPHDPNFLKISITLGRIEQFIESIFPSHQPPVDRKLPSSIEEAIKKQKEDNEAKWDLIYIIAAVLGTVLFMTFIMLGIAWLAGARFDIAYSQFKTEFGKLMSLAGLDNGTAQVTEVHETLVKSEL